LRDGRIGQLKSQFEVIERDKPGYVLISGDTSVRLKTKQIQLVIILCSIASVG
jgi:hypothetical protein